MKSTILLVGTSHRCAPVELRERVALDREGALELARELAGAADEAICVSTCCRTEVYLSAAAADDAERGVRAALARRARLPEAELAPALYCLRDARAVEHLFRVAAGLDSIVIGEPEILGQLKTAVADCQPGPLLERLFSSARRAGRLARRASGLDEQPASVASVVAAIAERTLGDISGRRTLVVGAGRTGALVARALAARGVEIAYVANRTPARAAHLAARVERRPDPARRARIRARARRHRRLSDRVAGPRTRRARGERRRQAASPLRPRCPAGSRPRDRGIAGPARSSISTGCASRAAKRRRRPSGSSSRKRGASPSGTRRSQPSPTIVALRAHAETIRRGEVQRLGCIDARERALVEAATARVVAKLLHRPTLRLRQVAAQTELAAARSLFGLEPSRQASIRVAR